MLERAARVRGAPACSTRRASLRPAARRCRRSAAGRGVGARGARRGRRGRLGGRGLGGGGSAETLDGLRRRTGRRSPSRSARAARQRRRTGGVRARGGSPRAPPMVTQATLSATTAIIAPDARRARVRATESSSAGGATGAGGANGNASVGGMASGRGIGAGACGAARRAWSARRRASACRRERRPSSSCRPARRRTSRSALHLSHATSASRNSSAVWKRWSASRAIALRRITGERAVEVGDELFDGRRRLEDDAEDQLVEGLGREGHLAGDRLVEDDADRVEVAPRGRRRASPWLARATCRTASRGSSRCSSCSCPRRRRAR